MKKFRNNELKVAVVGASGLVGGELLHLLEKRGFPVEELKCFNTGRKIKKVKFKKKYLTCRPLSFAELINSKLVFFASTDEVSAKYAPKLATAGIWCIDDSSKFRMEKKVPLVIPEINADRISQKTRLISGPNCTTTAAALALWQIHRKFGTKELRFATYQSISGAGRGAIAQFEKEMKEYLKKGKISYRKNKYFSHPIAMNLFPQVGDFTNGATREEIKMNLELKKIWDAPYIKISSTCVRVPVLRVHSIAAWIQTEKKWHIEELKKVFQKTEGIKFSDREYSTPLMSQKRELTYVNRLQKSHINEREFKVWISMDNLYKGAALNSVQIAEYLLKKRYLD